MQFVVYVHVFISICLYSVCTISLACRWFAIADRLVVLRECSVVGLCDCCSVLQNSVELHIHHIQNGLTQIGNLHAFAISHDST